MLINKYTNVEEFYMTCKIWMKGKNEKKEMPIRHDNVVLSDLLHVHYNYD